MGLFEALLAVGLLTTSYLLLFTTACDASCLVKMKINAMHSIKK